MAHEGVKKFICVAHELVVAGAKKTVKTQPDGSNIVGSHVNSAVRV